MQTVTGFFAQHPYVATFFCTYVWSAFIGALPSPTKDSKGFYIFTFKFFNILAGNLSRANGSRVEQSPNWQDALKVAQGEKP